MIPPRDSTASTPRQKTTKIAAAVVLVLTAVFLFRSGWHFYRQYKSEQEQRSALVPPVYWVIGPFGPELLRAYEPELHPDPTHPCKGAQGALLHWKEVPVGEGVPCLNFHALFRKDKSSGYAMTYIRSPMEQSGFLLLGSDDTIRVWLNGEPVHQFTRFRRGRPDEDRVKVHWRKGRNTLLVKVVNVSGDHLFFLKCVGASGLEATTAPLN